MKINAHLSWIPYKESQILYTDWTNLTDEQKFIAAVKESSHHVIEMKRHDLLELIDVTNSQKTTSVIFTMKKMALLTKRFNKKKAVIGISAFQRIVLEAVNAFASEKIKPFETREEALEWLIDDSKN